VTEVICCVDENKNIDSENIKKVANLFQIALRVTNDVLRLVESLTSKNKAVQPSTTTNVEDNNDDFNEGNDKNGSDNQDYNNSKPNSNTKNNHNSSDLNDFSSQSNKKNNNNNNNNNNNSTNKHANNQQRNEKDNCVVFDKENIVNECAQIRKLHEKNVHLVIVIS